MAVPSFAQGDRIIVRAHRHNPACHEESYKVGEHGIVVEVPDKSSAVKVRLDGHSGVQGNYYKVETLVPMITRPVRHRFVTVSVLHLEKLPELMTGDYAVWQTLPDHPEGGHFIGRILGTVEDEDGGEIFTVQPLVMAGAEYGHPEQRPWAKAGKTCQRRARASPLRIYLEESMYLRDISKQEIKALGLASDLGLEVKAALPAPEAQPALTDA
eukprot:TRINITY_DN53419_c0_g1_i1.p1 TRINITY_DN53419_c0_g1~~TRINITY_DN53419_c0_g1_i1.p1  ORF type:complete len:213 (-),score=46.20 TRINITY_DN53419_c0_g1_i1:26-664(-)